MSSTEHRVGGYVAIAALVVGLSLAAPAATATGGQSGVAALQVALKARQLYRAPIDGILGPQTVSAVKAFQRRHGLVVDGIPGPLTRAALGPYGRFRLGGRVITSGMGGWDVAELQFLLREHGLRPGPLDADMGPHTTAAVRAFQRQAHLFVDGVVGPATLAALDGGPGARPGGLTAKQAKRARKAHVVLVLRRDAHRLYLYHGAHALRVFAIAIGGASTPTPTGRFRIVQKFRHPWWYPPHSRWARHLHPIPPGPGNPLGTRWMGISSPGVGIHGTPDPASVGYSISHGCVRLATSDAEWLFRRVRIGTPVWIT